MRINLEVTLKEHEIEFLKELQKEIELRYRKVSMSTLIHWAIDDLMQKLKWTKRNHLPEWVLMGLDSEPGFSRKRREWSSLYSRLAAQVASADGLEFRGSVPAHRKEIQRLIRLAGHEPLARHSTYLRGPVRMKKRTHLKGLTSSGVRIPHHASQPEKVELPISETVTA